jgi:hypothetical protein
MTDILDTVHHIMQKIQFQRTDVSAFSWKWERENLLPFPLPPEDGARSIL